MLKLFLRLLLLGFVVWGINNLFFMSLRLPMLWGASYQYLSYSKQIYFESHRDQINTLFLGSSLTYDQIDNKLFDSLNALQQVPTTSFNFGMEGSCPVEIYSLCKHYLSQPKGALNTVFVELNFIDNYDSTQIHTLRRKAYYGINQYVHSLPLTLLSNYTLKRKLGILTFDFTHLCESEFKLGMLGEGYKFKKSRAEIDKQQPIFYKPLYPSKRADTLMAAKLDELARNEAVTKRMFTDSAAFLRDAHVDYTYVSMVNELLKIAQSKGIHLIFVLPPRLTEENYKDILPAYFSIPANNRIQLANANQFPDFYKVQYSFDIRHLNQAGSALYSTQLSKDFLKLQKPD